MRNQTFLVVVDVNARIIAVADPSKAPAGMAYLVASKQEHTVHEVQAPHDVMQRDHAEMKRIIRDQINAGVCRPHLSRRVKFHGSL